MQNIPFSIGNGGKMSAGVKPNANSRSRDRLQALHA